MAGLQHSSTRARVCYRSSSSGWQRATWRAKASCMFWKLKISKGKALSFLWFLLVTVWVNSDQLSCIFSSHASSVAPGLQTWLCRCATLVRTEISQQLWPRLPCRRNRSYFGDRLSPTVRIFAFLSEISFQLLAGLPWRTMNIHRFPRQNRSNFGDPPTFPVVLWASKKIK